MGFNFKFEYSNFIPPPRHIKFLGVNFLLSRDPPLTYHIFWRAKSLSAAVRQWMYAAGAKLKSSWEMAMPASFMYCAL